jgi:hypothetical protein
LQTFHPSSFHPLRRVLHNFSSLCRAPSAIHSECIVVWQAKRVTLGKQIWVTELH